MTIMEKSIDVGQNLSEIQTIWKRAEFFFKKFGLEICYFFHESN